MLNREQKKHIVDSLAVDLSRAKSVVFSDFKGLKTRDSQELRANLRKEEISHKVVKITLLKRALKRAGIDVSSFKFQVPVVVSLGFEDEVAPARIINLFARTHENVRILAGIFEGKWIDADRVKALAAIPGKQELRGQVVGLLVSPLRGLVGVLLGNIRQLLYALSAIKTVKS